MVKRLFALIGDAITQIQVTRGVRPPPIDAVIFVVDSADIDRLNIAKAELTAILKVTLVFVSIMSRKTN